MTRVIGNCSEIAESMRANQIAIGAFQCQKLVLLPSRLHCFAVTYLGEYQKRRSVEDRAYLYRPMQQAMDFAIEIDTCTKNLIARETTTGMMVGLVGLANAERV